MLGPILAPQLGGVITDLSSWRMVFPVNLPLGLVSFGAMRRLRPDWPMGSQDGYGLRARMVSA